MRSTEVAFVMVFSTLLPDGTAQDGQKLVDACFFLFGHVAGATEQTGIEFFGEQRVQYTFIDVEQDAEGLKVVERVNNGKHIIPRLVFEDGSTLRWNYRSFDRTARLLDWLVRAGG